MHALVLLVPQALIEQVSDALVFELDALSVTVEDADAGSQTEQPIFGEPGMDATAAGWERSRLSALFPSDEAAHQAADSLLHEAWAKDIDVHGTQPVPDKDWVRLTQSQFEPIAVTPTFWIVPTWHAVPPTAATCLRLDPGLAFGSGSHPTTRMCLRWIASHAQDAVTDRRVLDYGCGSGILAIAAALHRARDVDAVDIDPAAVASTTANASLNNVALRAGLPELAQGRYNLVMANILATPLKLLAPMLAAHVAEGGHLVLAGVLERQFDELQEAYAPWIRLQQEDAVDGWILLTGPRPRS